MWRSEKYESSLAPGMLKPRGRRSKVLRLWAWVRTFDCLLQGAVSMQCPSCESGVLEQGKKAMPYRFCSHCDEAVLEEGASRRVLEAMTAFQRQVNEQFCDPNFIRGVRRKLGLGQREAAALFGGGVNAFSRYETGKAQPPLALLKLLRLLEHHPELLPEVREFG